jgi:Large ribosomal RNA subunit accumulation protein YceD
MPDHNTEKMPTSPWRVPIALEDIPESGGSFSLVADAEVRAALARMTGLRDLPRLQADFDVARHGSTGLRVIGRVSAVVGQNCVVTLEPLENTIDEEVDLLFMPEPPGGQTATDEGRSSQAKSGDPEPLIAGVIDLGAIATEFFILGLDPYPRKPGAVFEPPQEFRPDEGPFAALAGWTKGRGDG